MQDLAGQLCTLGGAAQSRRAGEELACRPRTHRGPCLLQSTVEELVGAGQLCTQGRPGQLERALLVVLCGGGAQWLSARTRGGPGWPQRENGGDC
jgi:hypothetical protein